MTRVCLAVPLQSLDVGKTQVHGIINDHVKIMNLWDNGVSSGIKIFKVRKTVNHEVDSKMWDFFCKARSKNIPLTGKLLQVQAILYIMELNLDDFTASNGHHIITAS